MEVRHSRKIGSSFTERSRESHSPNNKICWDISLYSLGNNFALGMEMEASDSNTSRYNAAKTQSFHATQNILKVFAIKSLQGSEIGWITVPSKDALQFFIEGVKVAIEI